MDEHLPHYSQPRPPGRRSRYTRPPERATPHPLRGGRASRRAGRSAGGTGKLEAMDFFRSRLARPGAVLAPMAGFSDAPFRKLCRDFGSLWAVTEMVSAKALVTAARQGAPLSRSFEIGEPYPGEPELVIQLFAADPEFAAEAAQRLFQRYRPTAFDLNMGCPVKKVVNRGCGCELMKTPLRAAEVVAAIVAAVPVPVSVKMRLGFDEINVASCARAVVAAGASAVAVHGRTAAQRYTGEADWEPIIELAAELPVPVIGSGDVTSRARLDSRRARGVGVMVARGAIGRPWLFAELAGRPAPTASERLRLVYRHAAYNCSWYGEEHGMRTLRGQLSAYARTIPGAEPLRAQLVRVSKLQELAAIFHRGLGIDPTHEVAPLRRAAGAPRPRRPRTATRPPAAN